MFVNKHFIPIGEPCTDSLSLTIPEDHIQVLDPVLTSRVKIFYVDIGENGLVDDSDGFLPPKPYKITKNGISLRFLWVNFPCHRTGTSKKFLKVTLSAKLLTTRYFEGITLDNIELCYNYLMHLDVFFCTYEDFLNSSISDIDICINHRLHPDDFKKSIDKLYSLSSPAKHRFFNLFKDRNSQGKYRNLGLDLNARNKAKPATPYFKLYHKELELLNKPETIEFYNNYLFGADIRNLVRSEFTIRSYKHKQRLYKLVKLPEFKTLKEYLNIPKKALKRAHDSGLPSYLIKGIGRVAIQGLSPTDTIMCDMIQILVKKGIDYDMILSLCNQFERKQKSRCKSKLSKLITHIQTQNLDLNRLEKRNKEINNFLENGLSLGVDY